MTSKRAKKYPSEIFSSMPLIDLTEYKPLLINKALDLTIHRDNIITESESLYDSPLASILNDDNSHLIGEVIDGRGKIQELQLKGLKLNSNIQEYFASEHMHALGIPTSRALEVSINQVPTAPKDQISKILKAAPSFLSLGHFEWAVNADQLEVNESLFSFLVENFYPRYQGMQRVVALVFSEICKSTANMLAHWMAFGFCHSDMKTKEMSLHGITLGSGAFMENFNLDFNPRDHQDDHSYQNQPPMSHKNLQVLASCFQKLRAAKGLDLRSISNQFISQFNTLHRNLMLKKLGLTATGIPSQGEDQLKLIQASTKLLHLERIDYTFFWRSLSKYHGDRKPFIENLDKEESQNFDDFFDLYDHHLAVQGNEPQRAHRMNQINPYLVLKNHFVLDIVEAAKEKDYDFLKDAFVVLTNPFEENSNWTSYAIPTPIKK